MSLIHGKGVTVLIPHLGDTRDTVGKIQDKGTGYYNKSYTRSITTR